MSNTRETVGSSHLAEPATHFGLLVKVACALIGLGAVLSLAALWRDADRFAFGYLWGFTFVWSVALGSLFFVGLHHITHAVWSVVVRRVAEGFAAVLPVVALLLLPLLVFALFSKVFAVYPWSDADIVRGNHVLEAKGPYLNVPFFALRGLAFVTIWALFARYFVGRSLQQDDGQLGAEGMDRMRAWSRLFMPVFALTVTFASFDWLMSLDPMWFSTIYGVYLFSGMAATGLAVITIAVIWLRSAGLLGSGVVRAEHLYNLGALLFTFTCFWAYIAFSQFMLIWYANMPEETVYFINRTRHGWLEVSVALALLRFALPFFLLLSRPAKMNPRRLAVVSVLILIGQWLDLYWLIMPELHSGAPRLGWQELGPALLLSGILVYAVVRFWSRQRLLAVGDPLYQKSLEFHI
jgi:hypothetical protein